MAHSVSKAKLQRFINDSRSMRDDPDYPIFEAGVEEGKLQQRIKVLSFLENKYIRADDRPERGSPEAAALLKVASELSEYLKNG